MDKTNPLILRCLGLTGSFETGKLAPDCFSALAGDFDGQGLSFSALQWNIGQNTLQPLLRQMSAQHPTVMNACFSPNYVQLQSVLALPLAQQLGWARGIQGPANHKLIPSWAGSFAQLGSTPEWQAVASADAGRYFDQAKFQASALKLSSDRAIALLFDCAVQNGGVRPLPMRHVLAGILPGWGEPEIMAAVANAVADSSDPRYHKDVLARKLTIANGSGTVHGLAYDLAAEFGL